MNIEQQNKRLNEQKDCIIKELTDTIDLLHSKLSEYESKDNNTESLVDETKVKELEGTIELLKTQFEYSKARCEKVEARNETLKNIIDDAKTSTNISLSNKAFKAQDELLKTKRQLSIVSSRFDKFKNFIISNGHGDLVSEFLKICDKEDGVVQKPVVQKPVVKEAIKEDTQKNVSKNVTKNVVPSVVARNANKNVVGDKNKDVVVNIIPDYDSYINDESPVKSNRLAVSLGDMMEGLDIDLESNKDTTEKSKTAEQKRSDELNKSVTDAHEQKTDLNHVLDGYIYDWESRVFWMEDNQSKKTHLESIPDIRKAAYIDDSNEIFAFHVEIEDGAEDKFESNKVKFIEAYKKDIINNGVILKDGLLDTSGLLMLSEEEAREKIKNIIDKADDKDINPIINIAIFYDSIIRGFTTEELVNRYGLDEERVKTAVGSLTNLFKAKQLSSVHKSHMSAETVCLIDSALNKESITNIEPTIAKLYVMYIDGYGINELVRLFEIEKIKDKFVSSLIDRNAYKEIDEDTELHFRKDCFNKDLTAKQIAKIYDIPELMCVHMKNMYNRYYKIVRES